MVIGSIRPIARQWQFTKLIGINSHLAPFSLNRQDACSTRKFTLCGTGILPVHKKLIENGATSQLRILCGEKPIFPRAVGQPDAS